jgi:protein O-GlcNAc transferase
MLSSAKTNQRMELLSKPFRIFLLVCTLQGCCFAATAEDAISEASALLGAGKVRQAETVLRSAATAYPDSAAVHAALGRLLFNDQNYKDAVQELNLAEQLAPDSREYNMLLAAALLGSKRYGVAVNFLQAVQPRFERYPEFHYSLGLAYYNLSQFTKAKEELEEALRLDPDLDRASFLLAACIASEGDFSKAADVLRHLTEAHPANVIYWTTLGDVLRQMGSEERPEALRACHRALALKPGDPHTQFVLATILLDTGDLAGAQQLLERLEKLSPNELEGHVALARVYERIGQHELARKEKEIVERLQNEDNGKN